MSTDDTLEVRRHAAWYKAGCNSLCLCMGIASLLVLAAVQLSIAVFQLQPEQAAYLTIMLIWIALLGCTGLIVGRAREVARTTSVEIDRF